MEAIIQPRQVSACERLEFAAWDSRHFGLKVARIRGTQLTDAELSLLCAQAAEREFDLVYWFADSGHPVEPETLSLWNGRLLDRRVCFLGGVNHPRLLNTEPLGFVIEEFSPEADFTPLTSLAIAAGHCSRFRLDPRLPAGRFEAMYRIWLERSVRREIADAVWIARRRGEPDLVCGFVTLGSRGDRGNIGLISVATETRGQGVGSGLLAAAAKWLRDRNISQLEAVTQQANRGACRLNAGVGMVVNESQDVYHFWPRAERAI